MTPAPLLLLLAASAPAPDVLARVDEVAITRLDFDERVRILAEQRRPPMAASQIVADLVDEALLAGEARRQGLHKDPSVAAILEQQRRRLALDAYVEELGQSARPTDAALREMYHSTGDGLRLLLVKAETEADARAILERARKGGDLAAEAKGGLDAQLAAKGGDTGWVVRAGFEPALAAAGFAAKPGDLVGPVQLRLGWAVARVLEQRIGDEAGFQERKPALLAYARRQHGAEARKHVLAQLKAKAGVTLDEAFLRSLGSRAAATPAELAHVVAMVNGKPVPYGDIHAYVSRLMGATTHGAGPTVRIEFAWKEIEDRLLKDDAIAKGFGTAPAVVATLAVIERNVLAQKLAVRVGKTAELSDPQIAKRLRELRERATVRVDRDRVAALQRAR